MKRFFTNLSRVSMIIVSTASIVAFGEETEWKSVRSLPTNPSPSTYAKLFSRIPENESNLDFINPIIEDHPLRRLYAGGFSSGGIAVGDVNDDSLPDLFLTNGPTPNKLYLQTETMRFQDATKQSNLFDNRNPWSVGCALVDIENDGDLDLLICNYDSPNQIYINDGKGHFKEQAKERGLDHISASLMFYPADYDLDGDIDLFLVCNRLYRENGRPRKPPFQMVGNQPEILPEFTKYFGFEQITEKTHKIVTIGRPDLLYQNDGKGYFTDVTASAGIKDIHRGLSATWYDYNHDTFPDLFIGNDMNDVDQFYRNNGDGTFTDVTLTLVPHTTWFSMGADIADVNNDGRVDYLCVDMAGSNHFLEKTTMGAMGQRQWFIENHRPTQYMWNTMFLNTGTERMLDVAYLMGVAKSDWSWAPKFGDFDSDGWTDLFITNGMTRNFTHSDLPLDEQWLIGREEFDLYKNTPVKKDTNLAFRNTGELSFQPIGKEWGLDHHGITFSAVTADFNQDGHLDLLTSNLEENLHLYRNNSSNRKNRITIELVGTNSNRYGIGATVHIQTKHHKLTRYHNPYTGYLSSNEPILHVGLGEDTEIDELTIHWPNTAKTVQTLRNLPANHHLRIREPKSKPGPVQTKPSNSPEPIFKQFPLAAIRHTETPFNDYERQPLLPAKHSQLGPGMAVGNLDNNAYPDIFVGGAANQPGFILVGREGGQWTLRRPAALIKDKGYEDMGAVFIDIDGDMDEDLYISSGSTESKDLKNRLYLNDGKGNLTRAKEDLLPKLADQSSSTVAIADYDQDGDLDIFTASRILPGKFPLSPKSYLLENRNGKLIHSKALEQVELGMITSVLWSDIDNDSWIDLLLATEWGPIQVFRNDRGKFIPFTEKAGLSQLKGWWNGIAGGDLDNDGDMDYVVTNLGLNTKYVASMKHPIIAYYGEFGETGKSQFIEAQYEHNILFPLRGKSCSSVAMPHLNKKFKTYEAFAKATLSQVYPENHLQKAKRFETTTLESGILINDGKGKFTFQALPRIVQISPSFGVEIKDINGDVHKDILLVQNFFPNQHETGRMDAGLGQLLVGGENLQFTPIGTKESGISLHGDHTSLVSLDINNDQRPDFLSMENNGNPYILLNQSRTSNHPFSLQLKGRKGNRNAIGARVRLKATENSPVQEYEINGGGSYLSQSTPKLYFTSEEAVPVHEIEIRWPNGEKSHQKQVPFQTQLIFEQE